MIERWGSRIRERFDSDNAAVLPLVAGTLVFMIGMTAFGTDLGWLYVNTIRIQRSADAAALGGVIHMPGFFNTAESVAWDLAAKNGYPNGVGGVMVTPAPVPGEAHQLKVTVSSTVETFFLRVFGMDQVTIVKEATAEYILPLPLGSPENEFGTGYLGTQGFWAAIQAPYTKREHGDPFATNCLLSTDDQSCQSLNPDYRPVGYFYGIENPAGSGISQFEVQLYDAGFYHRGSPFTETGDFRWNSGSSGCPGCEPSGSAGDLITGATMKYTQYMTDATPLDHTDNPTASSAGACTSGAGTLTLDPGQSSGALQNQWATLCSFSGAGVIEGLYPLQVQTTGSGHAMSMYGLRACSPNCTAPSGVQPKVYAINDMSIWVNVPGGTAEFFLAEVDEIHAGKDLILQLFDPGDAAANVSNVMTVLGPDGNPWPGCSYEVVSWKDGSIEESGSPSPCVIDATRTTTNCGQISSPPGCKYNGDWLTITISLPPTYLCDPVNGCWWKIRYNYGGSVNDRTTWSARIIGNPIHLIFDG